MESATLRARVLRRIPALRPMRHRNFRWFWLSSLGQAAGMGMMQLTLAWLVLDLTGSVTQFGVAIFVQGLPMLAFTLFGGVLADRVDRRKMLLGAQFVMTLNISALATLVLIGWVEVWHVYLTSFVAGTVAGLTQPARMAYIRSMVERDDVMNAIALHFLLMNSSRVVGPSLAGGLIDWLGIDVALYANAAFYALATVALLPIRGVPALARTDKQSPLGDLLSGIRYAWMTPPVLAVVLSAFSIGLFVMPYVQLMPAFGREVLGLSASQVGLLMMVGGAGALIGNVLLANMGDFRYKGMLLAGMVLTLGGAVLALAFTPWYGLVMALLAVANAASTCAVSLMNSIVALVAPQELLGRVASLILVGASFMFVATLPMAYIGDRAGLDVAFAGGAVVLLVIATLIGVVWPPLRRLRA